MKLRAFGRTGVEVSAIGQGTWRLESVKDRGAVVDALRRGIDEGLTHVDTAEMYGSGVVETLVGEAIEGRRDDVFLASKVLPENATRRGTALACERSLKRLGTDHLDLYLLHWPGPHPLQETVAAFEDLEAAGKIRAWGVSNFDVVELKEVAMLAGDGRVACNQVLYHLEQRAIEHQVLPWCAKRGIPVVAYSPLGSGRLPSARTRGGRALAELAEKRGLAPAQLALAWITHDPGVFAIPKASRIEHVVQNARADAVELSSDEMEILEKAFPRGPRPPVLPVI